MQNVSENVKKTVQDAAYIAVGVGGQASAPTLR